MYVHARPTGHSTCAYAGKLCFFTGKREMATIYSIPIGVGMTAQLRDRHLDPTRGGAALSILSAPDHFF